MLEKGPQRLTNEQYMQPHSAFAIFKQRLEAATELHWHEFYEMHFILSGKGIHDLNGKRYPLQRGSVFLTTPADFHKVMHTGNDGINLFNIIFSREMISDELYDLLFHPNANHSYDCDEEEYVSMNADFQRIWSEWSTRRKGNNLVIHAMLACILVNFSRSSGAPIEQVAPTSVMKKRQHASPEVRKALLFMEHHFRESLTLDSMAKHVQLSANYFSECFSKQTGVTFQTYLLELRLQFAKSLLASSSLPVTEVCFVSGFKTLPHFERVFKRRFHASPRMFRSELIDILPDQS